MFLLLKGKRELSICCLSLPFSLPRFHLFCCLVVCVRCYSKGMCCWNWNGWRKLEALVYQVDHHLHLISTSASALNPTQTQPSPVYLFPFLACENNVGSDFDFYGKLHPGLIPKFTREIFFRRELNGNRIEYIGMLSLFLVFSSISLYVFHLERSGVEWVTDSRKENNDKLGK